MTLRRTFAVLLTAALSLTACNTVPRGTGDMGLVIERATGGVQIVETTGRSTLHRVGVA